MQPPVSAKAECALQKSQIKLVSGCDTSRQLPEAKVAPAAQTVAVSHVARPGDGRVLQLAEIP